MYICMTIFKEMLNILANFLDLWLLSAFQNFPYSLI